MTKLPLVFVISLLIHVESEESKLKTADDIPDLTMSEPVLPQEELDSLNQLRKDAVKSVETLASKMISGKVKGSLEAKATDVFNSLNPESLDIESELDLYAQVQVLYDVIFQYINYNHMSMFLIYTEERADYAKMKEFGDIVLPALEKRFEPFEKYLQDD